MWTGSTDTGGYGILKVGPKDDRHLRQANRLSWEFHFGPVPIGLFVLHRCDIRMCVRPDHLFLGTHAENMTDMQAKGRQVTSEDSRYARKKHLSIEQRRTIAVLWQAGFTNAEIVDVVGCSKRTVGRLKRHVP